MTKGSMAGTAGKRAAGIWLVAAMLSLAACGSKEEAAEKSPVAAGETKSADDVAHEAVKLERPRPGSYKQTVQVLEMDIPGMPKDAADRLKSMTGNTRTYTVCITDEDMDKGYKDMLRNVGKEGDCTYSKFDVAGGRLDAQMHCSSPGEGEATITVNGTVSETGSDLTIGMDVAGGKVPMGARKIKMRQISKRVGDCTS
ncbi:MAG: DUF3617 domain-containing protein [Novosphingobium sp.]